MKSWGSKDETRIINWNKAIDSSSNIVRSVLIKKKYRCYSDKTNNQIKIKALKGAIGPVGSILFHVSFLILLAGILVSVWTRFEGEVFLTEGQIFQGFPSEYTVKTNKSFFVPDSLGFQFQLQEFKPSIDPEKEYSLDQIRLIDDDAKSYTKVIRKYHALSHKGFTFYQKEHGFSPYFILKTNYGKTVSQSYVAFKTQRIGENFQFEDNFVVPGSGYKVYGRLYPDAFEIDGKVDTRSNKPNNPVLSLTVSKQDQEIYRGKISLDQSIKLEDYTLSFNDLRYWSSFRVVRDYGIPVVYFGFFMGITGLMVRLLSNRQEIMIEIAENQQECCSTVKVFGKAEREKALFDEKMHELVNELKNIEGVR